MGTDSGPIAAGGGRAERIGWYFYDFANSAFTTTVVTVFLGPYLTTLAKTAADAEGFVRPLGIKVAAGSFFPYVVSCPCSSRSSSCPSSGAGRLHPAEKGDAPVLRMARRGATLAMYFLEGNGILLGGLFLVANVSFGASVVFYNAYLPEIAPVGRRDSVSSIGWGFGYLGRFPAGPEPAPLLPGGRLRPVHREAVGSASPRRGVVGRLHPVPMATLRRREAARRPPAGGIISRRVRPDRGTLRKARRLPQAWLFLAACLLYNDGIQTVIALASQFGQEELGLPISSLTAAILMVQFVAFFGAHLFNGIAKFLGAKRAIALSLILWTAAVVYAYAFLRTEREFFVLSAAIAIVLGGSQALSRSLFSLLIPKGEEAEYFGLYEVGIHGTSWLGPLLFGLALQFTGSYRIAILSLIVFFAAGLVLLLRVDVDMGIRQASDEFRHPII
jgi:UMF1 family MFS transporter